MGQNHQSHLCCCLDNTSPRLAFTSTSAAASGCSIPRPEELVPVSPFSCPPRGPQLFHSQVNSPLKNVLANAPLTFTHKSTHSQERAFKCTLDFDSQVKSLLTSSHSGTLTTVARISFVAHSSCSCKLDIATRCHTSCCAGRPLWAGFCSLRGAVAAQLLPVGASHPVGQDALTGWDQLFPILFVAQVLCSIELVLAIGCHFIKNIVYTFLSSGWVPQFSDTLNNIPSTSCGTSPSNICLRSTSGVP